MSLSNEEIEQERAKFEAWAAADPRTSWGAEVCDFFRLGGKEYMYTGVKEMWLGWLARAEQTEGAQKMKTYIVMNYETTQAAGDTDYAIGDLQVQSDGSAVLTMRGSRPGPAETFRNPNAALAKVREEYGWFNAYLEAVKAV